MQVRVYKNLVTNLSFCGIVGKRMCTNSVLQVKQLSGNLAIMSDGRKVRLGPVHRISVGDYLEVYADIAIEKIDERDVTIIHTARLKRRSS